MSCKQIQKKLDLYAGDDLDGRESAEVAAHLKSCLACYRDFSDMHALLGQVRATAREQLRGEARGLDRAGESDAFVASVMGEIHGPPPPAPQLFPRIAMVSGWAAALLLGVSLGWRTLVSAGGDGIDPAPPRVIDHGGHGGRGGLGGDGSFTYPVGERDLRSTVLEAEFARQLDELRRHGGPSRSAPVVPAASVKTKSF